MGVKVSKFMSSPAKVFYTAALIMIVIMAVIVVRSLLGYVSRRGYSLFGWWRLIVGGVGLIALLIWG